MVRGHSTRGLLASRPAMQGSPRAQALHAEHPPIDLHADTLMWARWLGYDVHARHEPRPPLEERPRQARRRPPHARRPHGRAVLRAGLSLPVVKGARGPARVIHEQIDVLEDALGRHPGDLRLARTPPPRSTPARPGARWRRSSASRAPARALSRGSSRTSTPSRAPRRAVHRPPALQRERGGLPCVRPRSTRRLGADALGLRARRALRGAGGHRRSRAHQPPRLPRQPCSRWPRSRCS